MKPSCSANPSGGYDPAHFESLFSVEDRHFWFKSRNEVISILTKQIIASLPPGYWVLEMGCGDGNVLRFLEQTCSAGNVVGMDLYDEGLQYARSRTSCGLIRGDLRQHPFGKNFNLIGAFDVLEHISQDRLALRDLFNMLDDHGALLITVPAHNHLWSYFDELSGHCRRYSVGELSAKLEEAGFTVEYLTQYMASLHPFMWLSRKIRSKTKPTGSGKKDILQQELQITPIINELFSLALSLETKWLARRKQLPFGASLVALARKHVRDGTEQLL